MKCKKNRGRHSTRVLALAAVLLFGIQIAISAQNQSVTLKYTHTPIQEIFKSIQQQTDLSVIYNTNDISPEETVSVEAVNKPVGEVLDFILKKMDADITYVIKDNYIVLTRHASPEAAISSQQQKKIVSGTVYDENNEPLIGVNILIGGTNDGTATDIDGRYTLEVSGDADLIFSYIGYVTQTVRVAGRQTVDVVLIEDGELLEEVVVTALGIKRAEKALSYNVQQVGQEAITTIKDANFINALNGKVAGVNINTSSSGIGGASKVIMRGAKSINQSSNALYVIDGIPMYNSRSDGGTEFDSQGSTESIADINPEDIESMSVLTGAAAAALYGNSAANGAIVITTKKGLAGKTTLTVTQNTEFLNPFVLPEFQNRYGTKAGTDKSWGPLLNSANFMGYSPQDNYFRRGAVVTETVSLSTGTEKNQTYLSAGAINSVGLVPNNSYDRYNFTFRNSTSFLDDKMTLDVGASYIKQNDMNMVNQGVYMNPLVSAYLFPRGNDWEDVKMYEHYDISRKISVQNRYPGLLSEWATDNPYWINHRTLRENEKDRYMMNANISYDILDWLNVISRVRIDNTDTEYTEKLYATTNTTITEGSGNGFFGVRNLKDKQTYADFIVNINKRFNEDFSLVANAGFIFMDQQQIFTDTRGPLVDTDLQSAIPNKFELVQLDREKTKNYQDGHREQMQSALASVELGYKGAYYLTLTGRNDWPSQLAGLRSAKSSFFYPSVGTSFLLSEIFNLPEQINYAKFRASFASVGTPFGRGLATITGNNHLWNWDTNRYDSSTTLAPEKLKPERTDSWEIGLNARFLTNFNFDLSLYYAKTKNQTFDPLISPGSGYKNMIIQTGSVLNKGFELSLGYDNHWNDFGWSTNYTFSANKNEILELADNFRNPISGELLAIHSLDMGGLANAAFILKKGGTLGDLYAKTDLVRDDRGDIYVGPDGALSAVNITPVKLGSVFPKSNMAWRNDLSWKNVNLGFLITARFGGIVYSATQAIMDRYGVSEASALARDNGGVLINGEDYVDPESWYNVVGASSGMPQYYTYSATNVRLQEASLGYTFTKDKLWGVGEATVSLIGRNLLMLYKRAPFDPEAVANTGNYYQGIDYFMTPSTRNFGFSVRLKF